MRIETKRLILRNPKLKDVDDLVEGIGNYNVSKWLLKVPYPYKNKDGLIFLKRVIKNSKKKERKSYLFFIELKLEKKIIGVIGIHNIDKYSKVGKTGSWINKKYWRQGYMTEAKIIVNNFAFNKLKLRRLESLVYTDNKASNATQRKMGYKLEGVKRKSSRCLASGKIHNDNIYGLPKEDWNKIKKNFYLFLI